MAIIECVPNISEGRDPAKVKAVADAAAAVEGVSLIGVESDAAHNRSVITLAGEPEPLLEAAFEVYRVAAGLIDLNAHSGEHPRMGAVDVCPFIPVRDATMEDCVALARRLGERVGSELGVPVFLYESAATRPERQNLAKIRKGQFEKLRELIGSDPDRDPDFGPKRIHETFGCTAIGARFFLIAWNVNLDSDDVEIARSIGKAVREKDGGLPGVKGMGFEVEVDGRTVGQVSMNLVDYRKTSPWQAYARIEELATEAGVKVLESELIGVIPQQALDVCAAQAMRIRGFKSEMVLENNLSADGAGSASAQPTTGPTGDAPAYLKGVGDFLADLASGNPTPGGGAAAAVLGGVGAALTSMVANLTVGKKKYAAVEEEAKGLLRRADALRADLLECYQEDIAAFDGFTEAMKLPKETDEQKAKRTSAMQQALKIATLSPLKCARLCVDGIGLARKIAEIGNTNAASDAGVAALALNAAAGAAVLNMRINLGMIKDEAFVTDHRRMAEELHAAASEGCEATQKLVLAAIGG